MSEQKYAVTRLQVDMAMGERDRSRCVTDKMPKYDELFMEPIPEPADDWRKKWKDRDIIGNKVLCVCSVPDADGDLAYLWQNENGVMGGSFHYSRSARLIPLEPTTTKVEMWALFGKDGKLFTVFGNEDDARRNAGDKYRAVRMEGSYEG